jgi:type II secretion system protein C
MRYRGMARWVALCTAMIVTAYALLEDDRGWFDQLARWMAPTQPMIRSHEVIRTGPNGHAIAVTPPRPMGNDSSTSPVPQPLILIDTTLGRNSREGFARIGVNSISPQTYAAGALLANSARITEIYQTYVVLERDGVSARLYRSDQGEARAAQGALSPLLSVGGIPSEPSSTPPFQEDRLSQVVRPTPVYKDDKLTGLALYAGHEAGTFAQLGLEPGDVLIGINGQDIRDEYGALSALETLTHGASVQVRLERQGSTRVLTLDGHVLTDTRSGTKGAEVARPGAEFRL